MKLPGRVQPSAEIVRVGCAVALHFWKKSRTKRSFWRLGASLLEEVSYFGRVLSQILTKHAIRNKFRVRDVQSAFRAYANSIALKIDTLKEKDV